MCKMCVDTCMLHLYTAAVTKYMHSVYGQNACDKIHVYCVWTECLWQNTCSLWIAEQNTCIMYLKNEIPKCMFSVSGQNGLTKYTYSVFGQNASDKMDRLNKIHVYYM